MVTAPPSSIQATNVAPILITLSACEDDPQLWLRPHNMHLAFPLPVRALVQKLQIESPKHSSQGQAYLHHGEAVQEESKDQLRLLRLPDPSEYLIEQDAWSHQLTCGPSMLLTATKMAGSPL